MMQFAERHVLTVNKPSAVKKVLDALSAGVQANEGVPAETRRGLTEVSKQGFNGLILNLQVMKTPFAGASADLTDLNVCEMGGVLVLTGQVSRPWMLQVEELCRRHFSPKYLLSRFSAHISCAVAGIEAGVLRTANRARKDKGSQD